MCIFRKSNFRRIFASEFEQETWENKKTDSTINQFISLKKPTQLEGVNEEKFGSGFVNEAHVVDAFQLIDRYQRYFITNMILQVEKFD